MTESSADYAFSDRLKSARDLRGLSQAELAQKAGLQPSAISHFETGGRKPSFDNLLLLADVLQVTTDFLLGRTESVDVPDEPANPFWADYAKLSSVNQEVAKTVVRALVKNQGSGRK